MSEAALRQSWQGKLATAPNGEAARKVVVEITRDLGAQPETEAWVSVVIAEKFVDSGDWVRTWFTKERTRLAVEARAAEITRGLEQRLAQAQSQANVVPTPKVPPAAVAKPERSEKDIGRGMERAAAERAVLSFLPTTQPKIDPEREHKAARLAEIMAGLDREKMAGLSKPDEDDEINVEAETVIVDEDLDDTVVTALPAVQGEILLPVSAAPAVQVGLLNQKHAVIGNYGGKCAVLAWERWNINQKVMVPVFQTMTDFRNRYMNRYVVRETEDGITKTAAGKFWLSHPKRVTYDAVAFEPGQGEVLPGNRLNLWRDFSVRPKKGCWKRLRSHIYRVLGNGDRKAGRYIVRWLAWTLQNPGRQAEAVVVFQGEEGAGKGTLARALLKIFGPNGLPVSDAKLLVGSFSGHLHYCVFMFVDEAFWAGDVASEGRLKALITEEQITIEPKYFTAFPIPNNLHIIMSSNNDWVVPAGRGARRYAVFKVSKERVGDFKYFDELNAELDNGGVQAMLYDLLRLRLGGWHPKMIYKTAALMEQKQHSLRGLDAWIETILQDGRVPKPSSSKYPNRCLSEDLLASAKEHDKYTNGSRIARKLQEVLGVTEFNIGSARGWAFPELSECRRLWERRNGGHWHWHHNATAWRL